MARPFLFAPVRRAACAAAVALAVAGAADVVGASARSDYERLLARVEALRLDGPRPTPRPQLRRIVADAEGIARRHAGSGYADNALWQAATVALAAYRVYRQPADRTLGVQFLDTLVRRYPSSSLVAEARALMRRHAPPPPRRRRSHARRVVRQATPRRRRRPPPGPLRLRPGPLPHRPRCPCRCRRRRRRAPTAMRATEATGRLATLRGLRRTTIGDTIRLTLDFDGEVAFEQQRLPGPDRVFFDFARTAPIPSLSDTVLQFEGPTVRRVRLGRPRPDVTRLAIDLDGVATYSVFALYHPFRLTIDLQPASPAGRPGRRRQRLRPLRPPSRPCVTTRPSRGRPVAVPRTGLVPTTVSLPASMPAPAPPPPALLRANRVAAPAVVRPVAPPTRIVVVEPLLAVDDTPLSPGHLRGAVDAAPALATRAVSKPPELLRARRTQPLMVRAAMRPPRGLPPGMDLAAFVAPAARTARRDAAPPAPVVPAPVVAAAARAGRPRRERRRRVLDRPAARARRVAHRHRPGPRRQGSGRLGIEDDRSGRRAGRRAAGREDPGRRGRHRGRADAAHGHLRAARGAHGDGQPPRRRPVPLDPRQLEPQSEGGGRRDLHPQLRHERRRRRRRGARERRRRRVDAQPARHGPRHHPGQQARRVRASWRARSRNRW